MLPMIMQAKPEDLDSVEKRSKYNVAIIGCGQQGIFAACQFAEAGFKVTCIDTDQTKLSFILKGKVPSLNAEAATKLKEYVKAGKIDAASNLQAAISETDIAALVIPARMDGKRKADYSNTKNACKQIGMYIHRGAIVIVLSTVGVGANEAEIKETLENSSGFKTGIDVGLAYSPLVSTLNRDSTSNVDDEGLVAAFDKNSLSAASAILEIVFKKRIRRTENVKAAEVATLFESTRKNVNLALTNEFAVFCERTGIDYSETAMLLRVDAQQIPISPAFPDSHSSRGTHLLLESAEDVSAKMRIPTLAEEINEEAIKHVVSLARDALGNCGKTLKRAKISLLGATEKPDIRSPSKAIIRLAETLETRGAKIRLFDPYLTESDLNNDRITVKKNLTEALEGVDCTIIAVNHDQFKRLNLKKMKLLMKMPAAIVDLNSIMEPNKIEKEGFAYRGLGRGAWRK